MKLFECGVCGQLLFFENERCESCDHALGFLPEMAVLSALTGDEDGTWRPVAAPDRRRRLCANARMSACNWLLPAGQDDGFCTACRLNRTIPDLADAGNVLRWRKLESAKRRLVYSLLRLGLPVPSKTDDPEAGLAFDFLSHAAEPSGAVMTGHAAGLITIDLAEADDPSRESRRDSFAEPYRTVLGHFRHEIGHYYWDRLVASGSALSAFRSLFGDERADYGEALAAHHQGGPPADWPDRFVSAYASAHPWEDWAESWAHYMHIMDTLETAHGYGLSLRPVAGRDQTLAITVDTDPYDMADFESVLRMWLPLTYAVNGLNRSMGQPDLYPFVLAPAVVEKLGFVHRLVRSGGT